MFDHLDTLYSGARLRQYLRTDETNPEESVMFMPLSGNPLDSRNVITINDIPVLFPWSNKKRWYSVEGNRIYFHHDILKSAFYLLSGYQEYESAELDAQGRFPWKSSIQNSLGITQKPVVNYYFEVILEAFDTFSKLNGLDFKRKRAEAPILFLSHDVDKVKKYTFRNLISEALMLLGIRHDSSSFSTRLKSILIIVKGILLFKKDPYWNFKVMAALEHKLNISSTWYFLERGELKNSAYHFSDKKIRKIIEYLSRAGHEIGIHGTIESSEDQEAMNGSLHRLKTVCRSPVTGIRQHVLKYNNPGTPKIQVHSGFAYDATLGFAEQIGFRNSYAYPFRLFDFDNQRPMDLWQLPLNVMEVTIIQYMNVHPASILDIIHPVLSEVTRFNGVFSLLWHNCRLDEESMPGIKGVYEGVLKEIMQLGYISRTGQQAIDSFRSLYSLGVH